MGKSPIVKTSKQDLVESCLFSIYSIKEGEDPIFLIYDTTKEMALDFAQAMIKRADEVRGGGTLRNPFELVKIASFPYVFEIKELENGATYEESLRLVRAEKARGKNLVLILLGPDRKCNMGEVNLAPRSIDLDYCYDHL